MQDDNAELEQMLERRDDLIVQLAGTSRLVRQDAAHDLADMARQNPELVAEVADDLIDALSSPEAQTRWECLDALSAIALEVPDAVTGGFDGAEEALFDEHSAAVRLSAFRFLTRYGSQDPERSEQVWSLLSEAVQCYHGDPEYREMLICLFEFVQGSISDSVRKALGRRIAFDAKNAHGSIRRYSERIRAIVSQGA